MILRSSALLMMIAGFGFAATLDREKAMSECAAKGGECDETKGGPVCGTDKKTYPTRCHLIRAQCSGHQVSLKQKGPCRECFEAQSYALSHRSLSSSKFIPKCRPDGSYAPVQCIEGGGCWCSDSSGKPIENTTRRNGKPNCRKSSKSNTRRSSPRNISIQRSKRSCSQIDQTLFNKNVIKIFQSEYNRYRIRNKHTVTVIPTDQIVLDWKFSTSDTNDNNYLDKDEYKELKRLIKKLIKPKRCAKAFGKFCDVNIDEKLSRDEWSICFSKEGISRSVSNNDGTTLSTTKGVNFENTMNNEDPDEEDDDISDQHIDEYDETDDYEEESISSIHRLNHFGIIASKNSPVTHYPPVYLLRPKINGETDSIFKETDRDSDCRSDKAAALDEQKHGGTAMYVPECTTDGRYQRVQCYRSTGYCWCVHEDTGKNIPGTSVKDKRPQCDSIYPTSRLMKGCPEPKKLEFLRDLKEFLKLKIISNTNTGVNTTKWTSDDEKVATLSFVFLDKNKNKVWERKEWKIFRELVTAAKTLRKCGKKMPRYCDVNSDKKITLSEWLNCLQAQRNTVENVDISANGAKQTVQSKLKGPNPLDSYLKSD